MASTPQPPESDPLDRTALVYRSAQESARHSDILMWQLTAITWGADVLLLGMAMRAVEEGLTYRRMTIATSIIGIALTLFVAHFFRIAKIGQKLSYDVCREIEDKFPNQKLRLHTRIHEVYERGVWPKAKHCVWLITGLFLVFWVGILVFVFCRLPHPSV